MPQIVRQYARTERGVVLFRYHRVFTVRAGPSGQNQDYTFEGVYDDGRLVRARMLRYTINGSAASASQSASVIQAYEHPKPGDVFEAPWDARWESQYRDVRRGNTIAFTALVTTYGHGNGSFTFDRAGDVTSYAYSPTVMPQHATSGTVSGRRAAVLPGYWAMTAEQQHYSGHYSIFGASATVTLTQSAFQRYASLAQALRALGGA